jgi:hypothetical protein
MVAKKKLIIVMSSAVISLAGLTAISANAFGSMVDAPSDSIAETVMVKAAENENAENTSEAEITETSAENNSVRGMTVPLAAMAFIMSGAVISVAKRHK